MGRALSYGSQQDPAYEIHALSNDESGGACLQLLLVPPARCQGQLVAERLPQRQPPGLCPAGPPPRHRGAQPPPGSTRCHPPCSSAPAAHTQRLPMLASHPHSIDRPPNVAGGGSTSSFRGAGGLLRPEQLGTIVSEMPALLAVCGQYLRHAVHIDAARTK
jgi:hypothetical protein